MYAALTQAERLAIQSDLVWTGHYDGIIDGDFGDRSLNAVRAFQKASKRAETGILNPREREQLAARAKARQEQVGWRKVDDSATGVSMGLPTKLVPKASRGKDGSRWASTSGDIVIETFRVSGPAVTLATVTAQLRAVAGRKVDYHVQRPGFFVLIGSQGT
jgi:peptidoglycan hydrolase-like protein with peptidoglycan-binding domain